MRKRPLLLCCLLALAQPMAAAAASVLAVDINPMTQIGDPAPPGGFYGCDDGTLITNGMYGWTFQLTAPATVTGLAWYDQNPAGLPHAHEVGIWGCSLGATNDGLLLSLTIPAGTNASLLEGAWRELDLAAPVTLVAGYYVLAGTYYSENPDVVKYTFLGFGNYGMPIDPRIVAGCPAFTDSGAPFGHYDPNAPLFRIPDDCVLNDGFFFGPNLLLLPPVPSVQVSASGNQIVTSWPLWATNFVLETSAAAGPAASWTATTNAASVSGQGLVATNLMTSASAFYRLRQR
jgi:hypothetical protein